MAETKKRLDERTIGRIPVAQYFASSSAGNDSYVITLDPAPTAYETGREYEFKADVANTGAASLNVNGLGTKTIKKLGSLDLNDNDILAGQVVRCQYDGTYMQMVSQVSGGIPVSQTYASSSTGNDTYAITLSPAPTAYEIGRTYMFKADVANTGAASLNVNGLGAKTIKKDSTNDLFDGDIVAEQVVMCIYDGTYMQVISALASAAYGTIFSGDGSDGDVTISADTTLTRDMFYNSLVVNSTKVLTTAGYRIFIKNTVTINGTIRCNGGAGGAGGAGTTSSADNSQGAGGAAGTAGSSTPTGIISGGVAGVAGGVGAGAAVPAGSGNSGTNSTNSIGMSSGVSGGTGGLNGMSGGNPAGIGGSGGSTTTKVIPRAFSCAFDTSYNGSLLTANAGSGSGGGGSIAASFSGGDTNARCGGSGGGGGSGGSGGILPIYAKNIVVSSTGSIEAKGGNGGNGGNGADQSTGSNRRYGGGGGGGGAGGTGGIIILVYKSLINSGSISVSGGTGGTGGTQTGGSSGSANGIAGSNGTAGTAGSIYYLQV